MRKNKNPNTELFLMQTFKNLSSKADHLRQLFDVCYERTAKLGQENYFIVVLYRKPSCQMLSKKTGLGWVIEISWLLQESFCLKPNSVLLRRLFSIVNSKLALKTSFKKLWSIKVLGYASLASKYLMSCFSFTRKKLPFFWCL